MSSPWIGSWLVAFLCYVGAFFAWRSSGMRGRYAALLAMPFFTAPLFIAIGGSNSFVYTLDIITPILLLMMVQGRWHHAPKTARRISALLWLSIGLIPLVVTLLFDRNHVRVLQAAINCYRLTGMIGLLIFCSTMEVTDRIREKMRSGRAFGAFAWICIVLLGALFLQYLHIFNTNVFYDWQFSGAPERMDELATAGLFRGSLGLVGLLGVAAFLASFVRYRRLSILSAVGALAGLAILVVVGSKTSLFIAAALLGFGALRALRLGGRTLIYVVICGAIGLVAAPKLISMLPERYVNQVFGIFTGREKSFQTLETRQQRWQLAVDAINTQPGILIGTDLERGPNINLGYYHNEYLSALMNGGVVPLGLLLLALLILAMAILHRLRHGQAVASLAGHALFIGIIEAITVVHLMPGLYFASTGAMFALIYGLGLNPALTAPDEIVEDQEEYLLDETALPLESGTPAMISPN